MNFKIITVFEHDTLKFDLRDKDSQAQFDSLKKFYGDKGVPFYTIIHNGIKFNQYVGVIQVGNTLIEVLPKIDKVINENEDEKRKWRNILINMLRVVNNFEIISTGFSPLRIKPNTILDFYFEMFLREADYLLRTGLAKKYNQIEGNINSFKGKLQFNKHIQKNYIHKERFYIKQTVYDYSHIFNIIIYKTLILLKIINTNPNLHNKITAMLLNFPDLPDIKINKSTFENLIFDHKTISYKRAIEIAKLILLSYSPDLSKGRNNVLALMFDMNSLWERFIYVSLKKFKDNETYVEAQKVKNFWKSVSNKVNIKADLIITKGSNKYVLDTKWKLIKDFRPSPDDLHQMYVYCEYYGSKLAALVYPSVETNEFRGNFLPNPNYEFNDRECKIITISIPPEIQDNSSFRNWQKNIKEIIWKYLQL
ncbi:MAG: restriction endonuclease [Candidatus Pacearchaeota archaeon]